MTDWEEYENAPFTIKHLADGSTFKGLGLLMRQRAPDGSWLYRLPTRDEEVGNWLDGQL